MGQDVGRMGGVFGVTRGLFDEFGAARVRDTTINETFIVGGAAGAAMTGTIPVVELQFADFLYIAGDEIFHKLAKWRYMHGGKLSLPVVVRLPTGVLGGAGAEHSQSLEAVAMHTPGLKVVLPSNAADAKGLLKTAIRDPNPVLFFEHKGLYRVKGEVPAPDEEHLVPFGQANRGQGGSRHHRGGHGADGGTRTRGGGAARRRRHRARGDRPAHARPTRHGDDRRVGGAHLRAHWSCRRQCARAGAGAEIAARIQEDAFFALDAPVWRLGAIDTPLPQDPELEQLCIPSVAHIAEAARELMRI